MAAEPSELRLRKWLLLAAMILGPILLLFAYQKLVFPGLVNPEALDFAQLGRNLSSGRGFTTYVLRPLALSGAINPIRQPELIHAPLHPFLLALAFGSPLGAKDSVAALVSGAFYLLTIPVIYLLGLRLFNRTVGVAAALLYACNSLMLEYATSGLHIPLYVFLTSLLLLVLHTLSVRGQAEEGEFRLPRGLLFAAGTITSALYLTDYVFVWIIPLAVIAVALAFPRHRGAALTFFLPGLIPALLWMARNGMLTGNPFFALRGTEIFMYTDSYPGDSAYRLTKGDVSFGPTVLQDVLKKIAMGADSFIQYFPQIAASWVLAFFLPSLLFRFSDPMTNRTRRTLLAFLGLLFCGTLLLGFSQPLLVAVVPAIMTFAVAYLVVLFQQARLPRATSAVAVTLLAISVLYPLAIDFTIRGKTPFPIQAGTVVKLKDHSGKTDVVVTDQPLLVAWYGDRPALLIPQKEPAFLELKKRLPAARWLFLTEGAQGLTPGWTSMYYALQKWNMYYRSQVEEKGTGAPIVKVQGKENPVMEGLTGFMTVPPLNPADATTVMAATAPLEAKTSSSDSTR